MIETCPRDHYAPWAFLTLRGHHYTPSTRSHHWNRVRCGAHLGHREGGKLIVRTYGHPDAAIACIRIRDAYARRGDVVPLPKRHASG